MPDYVSPMSVSLRPITEDDLETLFVHQTDKIAAKLAQFSSRSREAFYEHWRLNILNRRDVLAYGIDVEGLLVGSICHWNSDGQACIGYWIERAYWGRGIATSALKAFLPLITSRPIFAHVAEHNIASQKLLLARGFQMTGELIKEEGDIAPLIEFVLTN
ncbi:GNAT family N-acetyltransferase [Shewanella acanthi]|uniref:GNAT family N-acetyltransferase n=1 Tax=Shewanella acanthi TaxID=2864212 RepID=UPI001C6597BB|nr:GNAT family N-acetyltransferase [Shewanella acanthi]QYJ79569.1 GNAT family N-acetyltransferase [Shewanella acanthi]